VAGPIIVKVQFQIVQALYTMRQNKSMSNPLKEQTKKDRKRYDAWSTKPADIADVELKEKYKAWLDFRQKHPDLVGRDTKIEKMYKQAVMMLRPWAWDDKYVPMIKETVKDKELLDQFLDPALNPKPSLLKVDHCSPIDGQRN